MISTLPVRRQTAAIREWGTDRSSLFDQYLQTLTAAERFKILAAEREYVAQYGVRLATATHVFRECMEGYQDSAPGNSGHVHPVFENHGEIGGDWSWKPERNKALGDMITFTGVPPSSAEACIRNGIHKGHGWRGL